MDGKSLFLWTIFSFWKQSTGYFHALDLKPLEGHMFKWENTQLSLRHRQKLTHNDCLLLLLAHVALAFFNNSSWPLGKNSCATVCRLVSPVACVSRLGQSWAHQMFPPSDMNQMEQSDGKRIWADFSQRQLFSVTARYYLLLPRLPELWGFLLLMKYLSLACPTIFYAIINLFSKRLLLFLLN